MPLIICEDCGKEISDKASSCLHCGCPVPLTHYEKVVLEDSIEQLDLEAEAESHFLEAQFILNELQANIEVYGSNSALTGATPANVELALQYIDRSLECCPESAKYMNLKALLLSEGLGRKEDAIKLLEKAREIDPRNITIESNLNSLKSDGCFIATAAYGSPLVTQIDTLRLWRKESLESSKSGRCFIRAYNYFSPPIASFIVKRRSLRKFVRVMLSPLIGRLETRYPAEKIDVYWKEER